MTNQSNTQKQLQAKGYKVSRYPREWFGTQWVADRYINVSCFDNGEVEVMGYSYDDCGIIPDAVEARRFYMDIMGW